MFPAKFDYVRAGSVAEAISLLAQHGDNAKLLAGGHSLLPVMKLRLAQPGVLIDIGRVAELKGIKVNGGTLVIGGGATYDEVANSSVVQGACPVLAQASARVGDLQVRNRGTVGGSLAHADPTADLTAVVLALGGTIMVQGSGGPRAIPADDFFVDLFTTALGAGEVLTSVQVPVQAAGSGAAYIKQPNPASGYAVVGVCANVSLSGGAIASCRIGITGASAKATRASACEAALTGQPATAENIAACAALAADGLDCSSDLHGSAEYRAHLTKVLAKRALTAAVAAAGG